MEFFYAQALEGPSGDPAVGSTPLAAVLKLWHACASVKDDTASKYGQLQLGNVNENVVTGCGAISEGGLDEVQSK